MTGPLAERYKDKGGGQCYGLKHFLGRETQEKGEKLGTNIWERQSSLVHPKGTWVV